MFGNLHFFVNSVDFISDTVSKAGLKPEQVRIVCSNNANPGRGKKSNQNKLGENFKIATTTDQIKPVNFYTSTCFEGSDIYDENGRTYIVSDKCKSHTLLDISTLIIQICGRIRDSKYKTQIHHIYSETRYRNFISLDEFKSSSIKQIQETKDWLNALNNMNDLNRKKTIDLIEKNNKAGLNEMYIFRQGDKLSFDENLVKLDIVNFKITHYLYNSRVTLSEEYLKSGFNVTTTTEIIYTDKLLSNPKVRVSFKELFIEYTKLKSKIPLYVIGNFDERIDLIEHERPLIKDAFEILGVDKVKDLNYNVSNIKRAIIGKTTDISIDNKIIRCLNELGVHAGTTKSVKE